MMNDFMAALALLFLGCVFFFFGALWRDGRALRKEKDLAGRIEALKLLNQSIRAENMDYRRFGKNGPDILYLVEQADVYNRRVQESIVHTLEWAFNRGARQGLQAALLRLRGWL